MTRKNARVSRLREQLKKKRESLADQFDFKMYIIFHFKEKVNFFIALFLFYLFKQFNNFKKSLCKTTF